MMGDSDFLFYLGYCNAVFTFAEGSQTEGSYSRVGFKILGNTRSQSARTLTVDNCTFGKSRAEQIIKKSVKNDYSFVNHQAS